MDWGIPVGGGQQLGNPMDGSQPAAYYAANLKQFSDELKPLLVLRDKMEKDLAILNRKITQRIELINIIINLDD